MEKDIKIKFEYSNTYKDEQVGEIKLKNPFIVCQGEDCKNNVETYTFQKNKDYKIKVNFEAKKIAGSEEELYFLPSFSFKSGGNYASISLISLVLFLLF